MVVADDFTPTATSAGDRQADRGSTSSQNDTTVVGSRDTAADSGSGEKDLDRGETPLGPQEEQAGRGGSLKDSLKSQVPPPPVRLTRGEQAVHTNATDEGEDEDSMITPVASAQQRADSSLTPPQDTGFSARLTSTGASEGKDVADFHSQHPFSQHITLCIAFLVSTSVVLIALRGVSPWLSVIFVALSASVLWIKLNKLSQDWTERAERVRVEAQVADSSLPETAEWVNSLLYSMWPLINSDYFTPFVDLLEDALQKQMPSIVHSVRIEDLDQGTNPLRVTSFRVLPNGPQDFLNATAKKAGGWFKHNSSASAASSFPTPENDRPGRTVEQEGEKSTADFTLMKDEDESKIPVGDEIDVDTGDYVNLEVDFIYRREPQHRRGLWQCQLQPPATAAQQNPEDLNRLKQAHMLLYLSLGVQKILAVDLPVWVEVVGIKGTIRLRLQLVPVAPFVKHVAFTFVGYPKLEISAKPLGKSMILDVMDLPMLSSYILRSVDRVLEGFVAPKSYTIDLARLILGSGAVDTYSTGVVCLVLHRAFGLPAADMSGYSDPFVSVSFARSGKPQFFTRIIRKSLNPIWQETAFIKVSPDEIRNNEKLRLTLLDADRFSADDALGKIELDLVPMLNRAHAMQMAGSVPSLDRREDALRPIRRGGKTKGTLLYSVGYFPLCGRLTGESAPSRNDSQARAEDEEGPRRKGEKSREEASADDPNKRPSEGAERRETTLDRLIRTWRIPGLHDEIVDQRECERKKRIAELMKRMGDTSDAVSEPPRADMPSGILSFLIHQIDGLELRDGGRPSLKQAAKMKGGKPNVASTHEEGTAEGVQKLPSSYCHVILNDEVVFRTRMKKLNPRPFINAGSERFVVDWTTSQVDIVCRDARMREGDPILGVVSLRLADLFQESGSVTRYFPLTGGLGYGRILVSLTWRSIEASVPRPLRGWNVGTLEIASVRVVGLPESITSRPIGLFLETVGGTASFASTDAEQESTDAGASYSWFPQVTTQIPVRQRYPSALQITVRGSSRMAGRHHTCGQTIVFLNRVCDGERTVLRLPVFEWTDWSHFEQDCLNMLDADSKSKESAMSRGSHDREDPVLTGICDAQLGESHNPSKAIGQLEIDLTFHAGIGPRHESLAVGDNEFRYAFETYETVVSLGERRRLRTHRRKVASASRATSAELSGGAHSDGEGVGRRSWDSVSRPSDSSSDIGRVQSGELEPPSTERAALERVSDTSDHESLRSAKTSETHESAYESDSNCEAETRRERRRAIHREHKGVMQVPAFRSLQWVKDNLKDKAVKMTREARITPERSHKVDMENEGISHIG